MDDETRRAITDLRAQVNLLTKQIGQLAGSEDRIKEAVAKLLTDVREDTYRAVMNVYAELKKNDETQQAVRDESREYRTRQDQERTDGQKRTRRLITYFIIAAGLLTIAVSVMAGIMIATWL